jgi:uncharacterized metal-binding protein
MSKHRTVAVIPCSGIGKAFGTVSREAAYELCENLRPAHTSLVALSKLVLGEQDAQARVRNNPAVTIDGCKLMCASKLVKLSGGSIAREVSVLDVFRRYKGLKPEGIAELNAPGKELARTIAAEISEGLDEIIAPALGGQHA